MGWGEGRAKGLPLLSLSAFPGRVSVLPAPPHTPPRSPDHSAVLHSSSDLSRDSGAGAPQGQTQGFSVPALPPGPPTRGQIPIKNTRRTVQIKAAAGKIVPPAGIGDKEERGEAGRLGTTLLTKERDSVADQSRKFAEEAKEKKGQDREGGVRRPRRGGQW